MSEMATNSPGQSIHLKSPRSPRQLPALPRLQQQMPIAEQRSPTRGQSLTKSPGTPLVFEFPPEYYPETPNTNFDFDEFGRAGELEQQRGPRSPRSPRSPSYYTRVTGPPRSPMTPNSEILHSPGHKSPIFQFCDPRKNLKQAASYPMSVTSSSTIDRSRSVNSSCSYGQRSPKPFDRRRNSCFGLMSLKSPMSPTIVTPTSHNSTSPKTDRSPDVDQKGVSRETVGYNSNDTGKTSSMEGSLGMHEKAAEGTGESSKSIKMNERFNKSQGCLDEVGREYHEGLKKRSKHRRGEKNISRRSTSDLTDMGEADTEITMLSSPRRRGSMKGGLGEFLPFSTKLFHLRLTKDIFRLYSSLSLISVLVARFWQ